MAPVPGIAGEADVQSTLTDEQIDEWVRRRLEARKAKDFKESDRIRDHLAAQGIVLEDKPGGKTQWRRG
jgi:cysteinyl-tRNA synthetase